MTSTVGGLIVALLQSCLSADCNVVVAVLKTFAIHHVDAEVRFTAARAVNANRTGLSVLSCVPSFLS